MKEALTMEEKAVKQHNINKGMAKPVQNEKVIDGEVYVKKDVATSMSEKEAESQFLTLFEQLKNGRSTEAAIGIMRKIVKRLSYKAETKEVY